MTKEENVTLQADTSTQVNNKQVRQLISRGAEINILMHRVKEGPNSSSYDYEKDISLNSIHI